MLRLIENLPLHVTGIHACYNVSEEEYIGLLNELLDNQLIKIKRINILLVLETDIKNFASGMWCGNVRIGLKHFFKWNKIAVVSDQQSLRGYSHLFKYVIPGKFRNFSLAKMDEAVIWVSKK